MTYPNTQLFINGQWQDAADGRTLPVFNPATGKEIGSITVSIGVAQFRLAESADAMIERCDRGLYQAKRLGRNRTVTETELEPEAGAA